MYKIQFLFVFLFLFIVSCKKNDDTPQEQEVVENFYAHTVGNTWNYEYFRRVGESEEFLSSGVFDAVTIIDTELINNETYFEFQTITEGNDNQNSPYPKNGVVIRKLRDSLGYLVNEFGKISYSNTNQEPYLLWAPKFADIYGKLSENQINIELAVGSFVAIENVIYAVYQNGDISAGSGEVYHVDKIGLVKEHISQITNPLHFWEKRLQSYELAED